MQRRVGFRSHSRPQKFVKRLNHLEELSPSETDKNEEGERV